jgi:hypothetical protein
MTGRHEGYPYPYFNDRRCGKERRKYSYTLYIPERRTELDRRSGKERRSHSERREITRWMVEQPERRNDG